MKKVLLLLAAVFLFTGMAFAQQTVTISSSNLYRDVYGNGNGANGAIVGSVSNLLDSNNNTVIVNGGNIFGNVFGSLNYGAVTGNKVTISSGMVNFNVYGGHSLNGYTSGNSVTVTGGLIKGLVAGGAASNGGSGYSAPLGNVANNSVSLSGGTFESGVCGGYAPFGPSKIVNNTVTISNNANVAGDVCGGLSYDGKAVDNKIIIAGGTINGSVYGGRVLNGSDTFYDSMNDCYWTWSGGWGVYDIGKSTANSVTITGGTINGSVYGARIALGDGDATYNTITISGSPTLGANTGFYGGWRDADAGDNFTGNTLNKNSNIAINSGNGSTMFSVQNFEFINFGYSGDANIGSLDTTVDGGTAGALVKLDTQGNAIVFAGRIAGTGGINKSGTGALTLTDNNTYTGNTVVSAGTLSIGSDNNIGSGVNTLNGGTLKLTGTAYSKSWVLDSGGGSIETTSVGAILSGILSGTGNLTKTGAGTLTLHGNNTYIGAATVSAGVLTGNIANGANLTVAGGATYDGTGAARFVNTLSGGGSIINTHGLTAQGGTFSGIISGAGSLIKEGAGTLTLSGANIYTGVTELRAGALVLSGSGKISDTLVLFGGTTFNTGSAAANLNRLDVRGASNWTGNLNMAGKALNFYVPNTMLDGETMLVVSGNTDISNSNIAVGISGGTPALNIGDQVILIDAGGSFTHTINDGDIAQGVQGISRIYEFELSADPSGLLIAAVVSEQVNPQSKILSEGAAAGAIMALQGADNINGALLSGLQEGKIETIAVFFGGNSKYDTGSSVEMSAFGLTAGAAKKFSGFDAGVFIEYVNGSFDTECGELTGDGSASAIGLGILAKKDMKENVYAECLIRAGQLTNDYKNKFDDGSGKKANFDYSSMYFGFSLGAGYIYKVNEKINIDGFGKYTLTNVSGGDADLEIGNKYEFDPVLSNRIKAGIKGEYKINETFKPYLSVAYDYELSGDINAKIDGMEIETPTLNGGTFSAGIGTSAKIAEKLTLDLSAQIYTGVREGVTGNLKAKYEF